MYDGLSFVSIVDIRWYGTRSIVTSCFLAPLKNSDLLTDFSVWSLSVGAAAEVLQWRCTTCSEVVCVGRHASSCQTSSSHVDVAANISTTPLLWWSLVLYCCEISDFCRAMLCISVAYAVARCLSVFCLSVMFVYSVETSKHNLQNFFTVSWNLATPF